MAVDAGVILRVIYRERMRRKLALLSFLFASFLHLLYQDINNILPFL